MVPLVEPRPARARTVAWELSAADGCDTARCASFLDGLARLDRAGWLDVGRRAPHAPRAASAASLDATMAAHGLSVTAWLVRDAIESTIAVAAAAGVTVAGRHRAPPPLTAAERTLLAAAGRAAEHAALGHLARPLLQRAEYLALVMPFHALAGA